VAAVAATLILGVKWIALRPPASLEAAYLCPGVAVRASVVWTASKGKPLLTLQVHGCDDGPAPVGVGGAVWAVSHSYVAHRDCHPDSVISLGPTWATATGWNTVEPPCSLRVTGRGYFL
jgi:hypothetical protein